MHTAVRPLPIHLYIKSLIKHHLPYTLLLSAFVATDLRQQIARCNLCSQGNSPHRNAVWNIGHGGCIWLILLCNKCKEICYKVQEGPSILQHLHGVGWWIFHRVHVGISSSVPPWYSVTSNGYVATLLYLLHQVQLPSYQILTSSTTAICTLYFHLKYQMVPESCIMARLPNLL